MWTFFSVGTSCFIPIDEGYNMKTMNNVCVCYHCVYRVTLFTLSVALTEQDRRFIQSFSKLYFSIL